MAKKNAFYVLFIVAAASLWGTIGLYTTPLSAAHFSPIQLTGIRSIVTALAMGAFILIKDRSLFKIKWTDLWIFIGMGFVSYSLFSIAYIYSIQLNNSLSTACILLYTSPIFVMLLSMLLFRERFTKVKLYSLVLAVAGCVLVSGFGGQITPLGLLVGLLSGLGYALYSIFSTYALKKYHSVTAVFYAFLCASVIIAPLMNWPGFVTTFAAKPSSLWPLLGVSILATLLPYCLYTKGMERVEATRASILACIEPLVATFVGLVAFSQAVTPLSVMGIACILAAGVLCARQ